MGNPQPQNKRGKTGKLYKTRERRWIGGMLPKKCGGNPAFKNRGAVYRAQRTGEQKRLLIMDSYKAILKEYATLLHFEKILAKGESNAQSAFKSNKVRHFR